MGLSDRSTPPRIEGILFDSGDTLVRPVGGEWLPGACFHDTLRHHGVSSPDADQLGAALDAGMAYLDANHSVTTVAQELVQFEEYYNIVLAELGIADSGRAIARGLAEGAVLALNIEPFPETVDVLTRLYDAGLRLGIISDTWPSLEPKYEALGLRRLFPVFVISSQIRCCKPDRRIFDEAIGRMGLPPERMLFVDNAAEHVHKANELGLRGILLARPGTPADPGLDAISNLEEVVALVNADESCGGVDATARGG